MLPSRVFGDQLALCIPSFECRDGDAMMLEGTAKMTGGQIQAVRAEEQRACPM